MKRSNLLSALMSARWYHFERVGCPPLLPTVMTMKPNGLYITPYRSGEPSSESVASTFMSSK